MVTPGNLVLTRNRLRPWCFLGAFGSVLGNQINIIRMHPDACPYLLSVNNETVILLDSLAFQRSKVGAGIRLAETQGEHNFAVDDSGQQFFFLLFGAEGHD